MPIRHAQDVHRPARLLWVTVFRFFLADSPVLDTALTRTLAGFSVLDILSSRYARPTVNPDPTERQQQRNLGGNRFRTPARAVVRCCSSAYATSVAPKCRKASLIEYQSNKITVTPGLCGTILVVSEFSVCLWKSRVIASYSRSYRLSFWKFTM